MFVGDAGGGAGEAVSAFSRESLAKSFPEDRRKGSRFTIENGEIYLRRPTAIVLRVHLIFFINKEFAIHLQHDSGDTQIKIPMV